MSAGGKGGSNTTNEYHGTLAGALGEGPAWSLEWIICGGKTVWSGGLRKPDNADYSDLDLVGVGRARFYWGTETQMPDDVLCSYEDQPGFRGWVYIVLIDCSFGTNGETSAPTIEVGWRRLPNQLIVSGTPSGFDGACTSNPVTVGAELLTSWSWGGLPVEQINAGTFQATADALQAEAVAGTERIHTSVAPLWNEQTDLKAALADLSSVSKVWLRQGVDGRIECGRWRRDGNVSNVTALTAADVDSERFRTEKSDNLPNSFIVEFRDATKHHKKNSVTVDNVAAIRSTGIARRQTASRSMLIWEDGAVAHGGDLLRDASVPKTVLTLSVRRSKAVNPDGTAIRPGDYFTYPVEQQGEASDVRLFRCTRREFEPTGPITIEGEMEINGAVQAVPVRPAASESSSVTPPVAYARVLAVAPETTDDKPGVAAFAARPSDMAVLFDLQYSAAANGDFGSIGSQSTFALPLRLVSALNAGATTIRVALMTGANGENLRRDQNTLLNWNGSDVDGRNDRMLLCIVSKYADGTVKADVSGMPVVEFVSLSGPPSAVAADTYDIPVLRGRRGTSARTFAAGAWTDVEVWCIPISGLDNFVHPDLEDQITSRAASHFQLVPYSQSGEYEPAAAWNERQARAAAGKSLGEFYFQPNAISYSPAITYQMPAVRLLPLYSAVHGFVSLAFKRSAAKPATPTGGSYIAPTPVDWSAGTPEGTSPIWMSQRRFTPTGVGEDAAWSAPVRLEGVDGNDGGFVDYVFRRAAAQPATPAGDGLPDGWSDGPPTGTDPLWMSNAFKTALDSVVGQWSTPVRLDGVAGADGASIFVEYAVATGGPWHAAFTAGDLYMRQKVGANGAWSAAIRIVGEQGGVGPKGDVGTPGRDGVDGRTTYFHVAYATSADGSTGFNQNAGPFIGTYVDYTAADSPDYHAYQWRQFQGTQGIPGVNGSNGQTSYLHIKYSNDGGGTFTANSGETPGDYLGQYTDFVIADSNNPGAYTWARIKGEQGIPGLNGSNGTPGRDGVDGRTTYFHVAFANSADGTVGFNQAGGSHIGTYVDYTQADSPYPASYTWRQFKGQDGTNGIPGTNGANGQTSYLHIKYSDNGGTSFTANSGETPGAYLGQYTDFVIADSNNPGAYTWARIRGQDGTNGGTVLGTVNGSSSGTPSFTSTIAVTVTTGSVANVTFSGSLANNGPTSSTFAVLIYKDGSQIASYNSPGNIASGGSFPVTIIATPACTPGSHTFDMRVVGYPEGVTLSGTLTVT